jgi:uncharacterized protein (DUF342 family)
MDEKDNDLLMPRLNRNKPATILDDDFYAKRREEMIRRHEEELMRRRMTEIPRFTQYPQDMPGEEFLSKERQKAQEELWGLIQKKREKESQTPPDPTSLEEMRKRLEEIRPKLTMEQKVKDWRQRLTEIQAEIQAEIDSNTVPKAVHLYCHVAASNTGQAVAQLSFAITKTEEDQQNG